MNGVLHVPALEVRQGRHLLYCFAVDGKLLSQFTAIARVRRGDGADLLGYQRPEVLRHVQQIRKYLETDEALLPNALVIAFDDRVRFTSSGTATKDSRPGTLAIPLGGTEDKKVGWLVDGQQRAAALREAAVSRFPVCVVGFVAESVAQQREQFVLINATKPLPRSLLYELLPQTSGLLPEALRKYRLASQLLDRLIRDVDSPLCGLVRRPTTPDGVIQDTSVLKMLHNSLSDGALFRFRAANGGGSDLEGMLRLLKDYWATVACVFPEAWAKPARESRLSGGPGIVALGFVLDTIVDNYPADHLPTQAVLQEELQALQPNCHWTAGVWDLGHGVQRRWNDLQNTSKDVRLLANYLTALYRSHARSKSGNHAEGA